MNRLEVVVPVSIAVASFIFYIGGILWIVFQHRIKHRRKRDDEELDDAW